MKFPGLGRLELMAEDSLGEDPSLETGMAQPGEQLGGVWPVSTEEVTAL